MFYLYKGSIKLFMYIYRLCEGCILN